MAAKKKISKAPQATPTGQWIWAGEGYRAFHPNPLPPKIEWTGSMVSALSAASELIGKLAGEGRRLPNPHLLMGPFIRREAVFSSRIEGTQSTLGEILASEAGAEVHRHPDDLQEVENYVTALEYGLDRLKTLPLSLRLILELHEKLMRGVRGNMATPGEFRRSQNWIGSPGSTLLQASYVPPPPDALMQHLGAWESFLHDRMLPPLVQVAMAHYQFEAIHPFLDGNGRTGRLMITLELCERGVLPTPLLYLSAFIDATRDEYYRRLAAVTHEGDWAGWIQYFLNGVARQSEDALSRAERLNALLVGWRNQLAGQAGSKMALRLMDEVSANPYVTPKAIAAKLGVAYNTVIRAIEKLMKVGALQEVNPESERNRVWCAKALMDILEEPARLTPMDPFR